LHHTHGDSLATQMHSAAYVLPAKPCIHAQAFQDRLIDFVHEFQNESECQDFR
jgi:hypothetical protein